MTQFIRVTLEKTSMNNANGDNSYMNDKILPLQIRENLQKVRNADNGAERIIFKITDCELQPNVRIKTRMISFIFLSK